MITIEKLDTESKPQVKAFVEYPFKLFAGCSQWVPPFIVDVNKMLNRKVHPLHEHSDVDFFLAKRDGEIVGRVAVVENKPYNKAHEAHTAFFSLFDCADDNEAFNALFNQVSEWARKRGLNKLIGPKGFGAFDGYGILVDGFEYNQMMTQSAYNYPYYKKLFDENGFKKEVDFVSCMVPKENWTLSEKMHRIARRVIEKGSFEVVNFKTKRDLKKWAWPIGDAYNKTFIKNWEYYPLTKREIMYTLNDLMTVADPRLIKIIVRKDEVIGFLLGFPDVSAAMQRARGHLTPWAIIDLMLEMRRTKWVTSNGTGVLPEYRGLGGSALMYTEMEKTVRNYHFHYIDMPQVAETTLQMRQDLVNLGGKEYKNHRVFYKDI
jgi:hypothetical protein